MILLVDIGNTRIKCANLDRGIVGTQRARTHAGASSEDLATFLVEGGQTPSRVVVSNVAGVRVGASLRDAVAATWKLETEFVTSVSAAGGIRNAYAEPAKLGVDRWCAMIGAHAMLPGPLCVVSVGTAMTIDGVEAGGRHLGGLIVAGPELMVGAVLANTSDVATRAVQGSTGKDLFADNTLGAVQQGAVHALAALVDHSVEWLLNSVGETPSLIVTGGAGERIVGLLQAPSRQVPDLVLRGLAVLAEAR